MFVHILLKYKIPVSPSTVPESPIAVKRTGVFMLSSLNIHNLIQSQFFSVSIFLAKCGSNLQQTFIYVVHQTPIFHNSLYSQAQVD